MLLRTVGNGSSVQDVIAMAIFNFDGWVLRVSKRQVKEKFVRQGGKISKVFSVSTCALMNTDTKLLVVKCATKPLYI